MAWCVNDKSVEAFWKEIGPREPLVEEKQKTKAQLKKAERETIEAKEALAGLAGPRICNRVYRITDETEKLWKPREILSPFLKGKNKLLSANIAYWIVYHWGRIHTGANVYSKWVKELGDFSEAYVFEFADKMKADRISSWSKVLSFADYHTYPVYDARTAISVNVAIARRGGKQFLYMPGTQNTQIPDAIKSINRLNRREGYWAQKQWNYLAYLYLLRRVVDLKLASSILDAEITLFANANKLAAEWVEERRLNSAKRRAAQGKPPKVYTAKAKKRGSKKAPRKAE